MNGSHSAVASVARRISIGLRGFKTEGWALCGIAAPAKLGLI
jgi:hypothetical protein